MLDKKGQSALEYLMTYGWALVVIVIVIAALVILVGGTPTVEGCTGSAKFTVASLSDSTTQLSLVVTNNTAMNIKAVGLSATEIEDITIATWDSGDTNTVVLEWEDPDPAVGDAYSVKITIDYTDPYELGHTETITCNGTVS